MFSKLAILATASLALSVAAAPHGDAEYTCNTGDIQCCNQVEQSQSAAGADIIHSIVGLNIQGLTGLVGKDCSPISGVGLGQGTSCQQQPVCCEDNHMNGLVVVGCSPINISL